MGGGSARKRLSRNRLLVFLFFARCFLSMYIFTSCHLVGCLANVHVYNTEKHYNFSINTFLISITVD